MSTNDASWRSRAACLDVDPELFFPAAEAGEVYEAQVAEAKAVCATCPVRARCLAEALVSIPDGVAGGLSEGERRDLSAARRHSSRGLVADAVAVERARYGRSAAVSLVEAGRSVQVVADLIGVSDRTVARWVADRCRVTGGAA